MRGPRTNPVYIISCTLIILCVCTIVSPSAVKLDEIIELTASFISDTTGLDVVADQMRKYYYETTEYSYKELAFEAYSNYSLNFLTDTRMRSDNAKREYRSEEDTESYEDVTFRAARDASARDSIPSQYSYDDLHKWPFTASPSTASGGYVYPPAVDRTGDFMRYPFEAVSDLASGPSKLFVFDLPSSVSQDMDAEQEGSRILSKLYTQEQWQISNQALISLCDGAPVHPYPINTPLCIPECATGFGFISSTRDFRRAEGNGIYKKMLMLENTLKLQTETLNHLYEMQRLEIERLLANDVDLAILRMPYYAGGGRLELVINIVQDTLTRYQRAKLKDQQVLQIIQDKYMALADAFFSQLKFDRAYFAYKKVYKLLIM